MDKKHCYFITNTDHSVYMELSEENSPAIVTLSPNDYSHFRSDARGRNRCAKEYIPEKEDRLFCNVIPKGGFTFGLPSDNLANFLYAQGWAHVWATDKDGILHKAIDWKFNSSLPESYVSFEDNADDPTHFTAYNAVIAKVPLDWESHGDHPIDFAEALFPLIIGGNTPEDVEALRYLCDMMEWRIDIERSVIFTE